MAIKISSKRKFVIRKGDDVVVTLDDPNPALDSGEVKDFYSATYPELIVANTSAEVGYDKEDPDTAIIYFDVKFKEHG